jgi:tetratricopeptide (TPR) repeat protein
VHGSLGQVDEAQAQLKEALNLYQEIGDPSGTANTLNDLSIVAARRGRQALAVRLNRECLAMRRQNGDRWGVGTSLNNLGYLAYLGGEHKQAIEYLSEGLVIQREIGDRYHIANCLSNLGAAAAALGEGEKASAYLYEALEIAFQIGARPLALEVSAGIGALLAEDEAQDGEQATEILTFVHDHPQTDKWTSERAERSLAQLSARLAPDIWAKAQERGRAGTLEAVVSSLLGRDRAA